TARGARQEEPRDRRPTLRQPEHGRTPPPQGVPKARREIPHPARPPCARAPSAHRRERDGSSPGPPFPTPRGTMDFLDATVARRRYDAGKTADDRHQSVEDRPKKLAQPWRRRSL